MIHCWKILVSGLKTSMWLSPERLIRAFEPITLLSSGEQIDVQSKTLMENYEGSHADDCVQHITFPRQSSREGPEDEERRTTSI